MKYAAISSFWIGPAVELYALAELHRGADGRLQHAHNGTCCCNEVATGADDSNCQLALQQPWCGFYCFRWQPQRWQVRQVRELEPHLARQACWLGLELHHIIRCVCVAAILDAEACCAAVQQLEGGAWRRVRCGWPGYQVPGDPAAMLGHLSHCIMTVPLHLPHDVAVAQSCVARHCCTLIMLRH